MKLDFECDEVGVACFPSGAEGEPARKVSSVAWPLGQALLSLACKTLRVGCVCSILSDEEADIVCIERRAMVTNTDNVKIFVCVGCF